LEIAGAIPTFPQPRLTARDGKVEIQKQDFHFSTLFLSIQNQNRKENQSQPVTLLFRLISGLENAAAPNAS